MQLIDRELIGGIARRAEQSPRRRMNHNFHTGPADNPHRFLNVMLRGTYVQPHRHLAPPKAETFVVLEGRAAVIRFDDAGQVLSRTVLGPGDCWGIDLPPGVWHTVVVLSERAVCFEVKPGPWNPATDKEFAEWAPAEGDSACAAYLETLLAGL